MRRTNEAGLILITVTVVGVKECMKFTGTALAWGSGKIRLSLRAVLALEWSERH